MSIADLTRIDNRPIPDNRDEVRVFLQVWAENERAVRLYESFGFRKAGTTTFTIGAEAMEDLVMVLDRSDAARECR